MQSQTAELNLFLLLPFLLSFSNGVATVVAIGVTVVVTTDAVDIIPISDNFIPLHSFYF